MKLYRLLWIPCFLAAQTLDESVLSHYKTKELEYSQEKIEAENAKLRDSWLNPILLNYTGSYKNQFGFDQESYSAGVSIDQPIFKSGGIYFGIKYAQASAHFNNLGVTMEKTAMITQALTLMMQLKKLDLSIEQAALQLQDAKALLDYNVEQLAIGELDSSKVGEQEIVYNEVKMRAFDLENQRMELLNSLKIFSDVDYKTVRLPTLALVEKEDYLNRHMELEQLQAKQARDRYFKNVTVTKYLPSLSATASYSYMKNVNQALTQTFVRNDETTYASYGFRLSMPLFDINVFRDIESAKVDYLKSSVALESKKEELDRFYTMQLNKIRHIDQKIALAQKNVTLYTKVLALVSDGYGVGDKSLLELNRTKNALSIKSKEVEMIVLDKQIELLKLYEKLHDL